MNRRVARPTEKSPRSRALPCLFLACLLALVCFGIRRSETRILASDQFAYLTQARAFAKGALFPLWAPWEVLGGKLRGGDRAELFHSSMIASTDGLRARYSPGFPLLLALASAVRPDGAFLVAPIFFLSLLLLLRGILGTLLAPDPDRAWIALSSIAVTLLLPTQLHLWALTPLRDIPAHVFGLGGLLLFVRESFGRDRGTWLAAAAGASVGLAGTIRPDALLYAVPAGALLVTTPGRLPKALAAAFGAALGFTPLLAYDHLAWGGFFASPQIAELETIRTVGSEPAGLHAAPPSSVSGPSRSTETIARTPGRPGAMRLAHLRWMLPGMARFAGGTCGAVILALAALGGIRMAMRERRALLVVLPYGVVAILFYGTWGKLSPRYLTGLILCLCILVAFGLATCLQAGARANRELAARARCVAALAAACLSALVLSRRHGLGGTGVLEIEALVLASVSLSPVLASGPRRFSPAALLAAALILDAALRTWTALPGPRFGPEEVKAARQAIAEAVGPRAFVFVSGPLDLAAENIEYYTPAHALPAVELRSIGWTLSDAAVALLEKGYSVHLLISVRPGESGERYSGIDDLAGTGLRARLLGRKNGKEAEQWFVRGEANATAVSLWRIEREESG